MIQDFKLRDQSDQGAWHTSRHTIAVLITRVISSVEELDQAVLDLRKVADYLEQERGALEQIKGARGEGK